MITARSARHCDPGLVIAKRSESKAKALGRGGWSDKASRQYIDNTWIFTANGPSNDISVVDLATNTVTKKVKGGTGTYGMVVLPR